MIEVLIDFYHKKILHEEKIVFTPTGPTYATWKPIKGEAFPTFVRARMYERPDADKVDNGHREFCAPHDDELPKRLVEYVK